MLFFLEIEPVITPFLIVIPLGHDPLEKSLNNCFQYSLVSLIK